VSPGNRGLGTRSPLSRASPSARFIIGNVGFLLLVPGLLLTAGGIALLVGSLRRARTEQASTRWPQTSGTVRSATVVEHPGGEDMDGNRTSTWWSVTVEYEYAVAGRTHRNRAPGRPSHESREEAEAVLPAPGSPVTVFHDPATPSRSVLQPGASLIPFAGVFVAAILLFGGLVTSALGVALLIAFSR